MITTMKELRKVWRDSPMSKLRTEEGFMPVHSLRTFIRDCCKADFVPVGRARDVVIGGTNVQGVRFRELSNEVISVTLANKLMMPVTPEKEHHFRARRVAQFLLKEADSLEKTGEYILRRWPTHSVKREGRGEKWVFTSGGEMYQEWLDRIANMSNTENINEQFTKIEHTADSERRQIVEFVYPEVTRLRDLAAAVQRGLVRSETRRKAVAKEALAIFKAQMGVNYAPNMTNVPTEKVDMPSPVLVRNIDRHRFVKTASKRTNKRGLEIKPER